MPNIFRVTATCLVDGQTCQNVFHLSDPTSGMLETTVADKVDASWLPQIRGFQHSGVLWVSIDVRRVSPAGPATFRKVISVTGSGVAEGDADNSMISSMLAFRTNTAGRHGRGFLFIAGTSFQRFQKGIVKTTSLTAGATFINALKAAFLGATPSTGLNLVIARKSDPSQVVQVTDILQDPLARSLVRRRIGRGI